MSAPAFPSASSSDSPAGSPADPGSDVGPHSARENAYLRQRNAQLQDDVVSLQAEVERLRQIVERLHGRTTSRSSPVAAPDPLAGGQ